MSFLRGEPRSRWPLERALEALSQSARRAGAAGGWWIAGMGYGVLAFGWTFGYAVAAPVLQAVLPPGSDLLGWLGLGGEDAGSLTTLLLLDSPRGLLGLVSLVLFSRLAVGLARLGPEEAWDTAREGRRTPRLGRVWQAGQGQTRQTVALWLQVLLMMGLATVLFLSPARILTLFGERDWELAAGLMGGFALTLALLYGFLLSVIFQLALHSLARNQRGVGSALLHAWRLARNDAGATARAVLVDASLYALVVALQVLLWTVFSVVSEGLSALAALGLEAWMGATRCGLWSRAYEGLGGVDTVQRPSGPAAGTREAEQARS